MDKGGQPSQQWNYFTCKKCSNNSTLYDNIIFSCRTIDSKIYNISYIKKGLFLVRIDYSFNTTTIPSKDMYKVFNTLYDITNHDVSYLKFNFIADIRPDNFHVEVIRLQNLYVYS